MPIAISDDHRALAQTVSEFLAARGARAAARNLLEAKTDGPPDFWGEVGKLGWLGLHLPEEYGPATTRPGQRLGDRGRGAPR